MGFLDQYSKDEFEKIIKASSSYKEALTNLGYKTTSGGNNKTLKNKIKEYNVSVEHFKSPAGGIKRTVENVFIENSTATQSTLRRFYLKGNYTQYKCSICGQEPFWNGKELTMTLDHINGNNKDDRLENLRWVCPNCDRQLETFAGKKQKNVNKKTLEEVSSSLNHCIDCGIKINKRSIRCSKCTGEKRKKENVELENRNIPNRETLKEEIRKFSFLDLSKKYQISDTAIKKWCKSYNLPDKKYLIKQISDEDWENENFIFESKDIYSSSKEEIINYFFECKSVTKTAKNFNATNGTISLILKENQIDIEKITNEEIKKSISQFDKKGDYIRDFESIYDAARWIEKEKISTSSYKGIGSHIGSVVSGNRKSAYGFIWKSKQAIERKEQ